MSSVRSYENVNMIGRKNTNIALPNAGLALLSSALRRQIRAFDFHTVNKLNTPADTSHVNIDLELNT